MKNSAKPIIEALREAGVPYLIKEMNRLQRRYHRGLDNFFRLYRKSADRWWFFDNSGPEDPRLIACGSRDRIDQIAEAAIWNSLLERYR